MMSVSEARIDENAVDSLEELGPIDFLCIEFPHRHAPGAGIQLLLHLVDRGIVRVLDLAFLRKEADGSVHRVPLADLGPDLAPFEGAASGLIDDEDLYNAAEAIAPDSAAALLIYENRWAAPLATTLRREGAQ